MGRAVEVGQLLGGKLRVLRVLGAGGLGEVYEVEHAATGNRHALKILHREHANDPDAVSRLMREAGVGARVGSDKLVQTIDAGRLDDGRVYLLMELLEGRTWRQLLADQGTLHPVQAVRLALEVCEGLSAAHAAGVVHRDLKPDNIFLVGAAGAERVKLLDFGLAKNLPGYTDRFGALTVTGHVMGTPHYMAPEQGDGTAVGPWTDQYALAVTLYESLSGARPHEGGSLAEIIARIHEGDFVPLGQRAPHLPPELARAVDRGMDRDPRRRFEDVRAFASAIAPVAEAVPMDSGTMGVAVSSVASVPTAPAGSMPATRPPPAKPPRSPLVWAASALLVAFVALCVAIAWVASERLGEDPAPAEQTSRPSEALPGSDDLPAGEPLGQLSPRLQHAARTMPSTFDGWTHIYGPRYAARVGDQPEAVMAEWRRGAERLVVWIFDGWGDTPTTQAVTLGETPSSFFRDIEVRGVTARHWQTRYGGDVLGGVEADVGCFHVRVSTPEVRDGEVSRRAFERIDLERLAEWTACPER